jgi:hypothetical protein
VKYLSPFVTTGNAVFFMNTDYPAAPGTGPFFRFPFDEIPDTEGFDVLQVLDHAHTIPGSVPLI